MDKFHNNLGYQVWFVSDLHFSHKNIMRHHPERAKEFGISVDDIAAHDRKLIEQWNNTIGKKDHVYIIGDFSFGNTDEVRRLVQKLNGQKHLILGNHDKSSAINANQSYFNEVVQLKEATFKPKNFPYLKENFRIFMCHYPMLTWDSKMHGVVCCVGHVHGFLDDYFKETKNLTIDVGYDSKLLSYHGFISLEQLYYYFKEKSGGMLFDEYAMQNKGYEHGNKLQTDGYVPTRKQKGSLRQRIFKVINNFFNK